MSQRDLVVSTSGPIRKSDAFQYNNTHHIAVLNVGYDIEVY